MDVGQYMLEALVDRHKNSEYDQDILQSQTTYKPMAPQGKATQQSRDTRKTNQEKQPALFSQSRWLQY